MTRCYILRKYDDGRITRKGDTLEVELEGEERTEIEALIDSVPHGGQVEMHDGQAVGFKGRAASDDGDSLVVLYR